MKRSLKKISVRGTLLSGILAVILAVLIDAVVVFCGEGFSVVAFGAMTAVLFLGLCVCPKITDRGRRTAVLLLTALGVLLPLGCAACWYSVSKNASWVAVDDGKEALYGDQRVMLLVPHQDDEINVLGSVLAEYSRYGSEVYVVYSTNGDYRIPAQTRYREAMEALAVFGIPEDHVIFLGYGDQWSEPGPHIYNGEPGAVMTSIIGRTQTYGTEISPAWRDGVDYTINNFLSDIESVILAYRPDVICCVDYDHHIDHRALSMSFEKVMGKILREQPDYRPTVYKGYAYGTAWEAERDFYGENLLSTKDPFGEDYNQKPGIYQWDSRVRLPVSGENLSRSLVTSGAYRALSSHASQNAGLFAPSVVNGDKVFWERSTDSLCYQAEVTVSSGDPALLTDFMLVESLDLTNRGDEPYDGVWIPEDEEKTAVVTFSQPQDIDCIVLYDHPDEAANVLNAAITFDDGTVVETGPLDPGGAATEVFVEKRSVNSFAVTLLETEGAAGLTELEARAGGTAVRPYVKIMDEAENFVYDYWINEGGSQEFLLYAVGMEDESWSLSCQGEGCTAVWQEDRIRVECSAGEGCVVTVKSEDGRVWDSVYIQNPTAAERGWAGFWLGLEEKLLEMCAEKQIHKKLILCRVWERVAALAG